MEKLRISTRILQSSIFSPILYLSYNANLIDKYIQLDSNIKISDFIDDFILLAIGKSLEVTYGLFFSIYHVCFE